MTSPRNNPRFAALIASALLVLGALVAAGAWAGPGGGGGGGGGGGDGDTSATVIGATKRTPPPTCPTPSGQNPPAEKLCQVMGKVTGFQLRADGRSGIFKVREPGRIVAWSVDLSRPNRDERDFFEDALGSDNLGVDPVARLAILSKQGDGEFKLTKQSPLVDLKPFLGERPIFTLNDPLKVKPGLIVALTTPTWLPNFGLAGPETDAWRASRNKGQCGDEPGDSAKANEADLTKRSRAQQKVGDTRSYACRYESARLLYRAFLAPSR